MSDAKASALEPWVGTVPLAGKLTFVFSGLCCFVPTGTSALRILLVDANKDDGPDNPRHGPALAIVRFAKPNVILSGYPTVKPLDGEELRVTGGNGGSVDLAGALLVNMGLAANCPTHPDHAKAHADSQRSSRNVVARLVLDGPRLGCDLKVEPPAQVASYEFKTSPTTPPYYTVPIVDELRISANLPESRLCLEAGRLTAPSHKWWSQELCGPNDWAAVVILCNLPIHQPFTGPHAGHADHHFVRYYDIAQLPAHASTVPDVSGLMTWPACFSPQTGGHVPRCAMALFDP